MVFIQQFVDLVTAHPAARWLEPTAVFEPVE
jgi:hypothetical protein